MKKYWLIVLSLLACVFATSFADNIVSVQVVWNWLVIGTPEAVTLGTVTAGNSTWYTFQWDKFFWIRDLRWAENWHYTTIQCDWLYQSGWNWLITWVMLKSTEWILYWWLANGTAINPLLRQWSWADITEPQLYFYRNNNEHSGWVTNIYIDRPTITVVVPAGTPAWIYKWRITYTLYDTSFVY
jgi:hypothetical protein